MIKVASNALSSFFALCDGVENFSPSRTLFPRSDTSYQLAQKATGLSYSLFLCSNLNGGTNRHFAGLLSFSMRIATQDPPRRGIRWVRSASA